MSPDRPHAPTEAPAPTNTPLLDGLVSIFDALAEQWWGKLGGWRHDTRIIAGKPVNRIMTHIESRLSWADSVAMIEPSRLPEFFPFIKQMQRIGEAVPTPTGWSAAFRDVTGAAGLEMTNELVVTLHAEEGFQLVDYDLAPGRNGPAEFDHGFACLFDEGDHRRISALKLLRLPGLRISWSYFTALWFLNNWSAPAALLQRLAAGDWRLPTPPESPPAGSLHRLWSRPTRVMSSGSSLEAAALTLLHVPSQERTRLEARPGTWEELERQVLKLLETKARGTYVAYVHAADEALLGRIIAYLDGSGVNHAGT